MRVLIGGYAQGKLEYITDQLNKEGKKYLLLNENTERQVLSENSEELLTDLSGYQAVIIDHLHLLVKEEAGKQPDSIADSSSDLNPLRERIMDRILKLDRKCESQKVELIIICDELGCGIIPAEYSDRQWREDTGRILCELAKQAESVERVVCGIAWKLK